jgi:hypothetical protein
MSTRHPTSLGAEDALRFTHYSGRLISNSRIAHDGPVIHAAYGLDAPDARFRVDDWRFWRRSRLPVTVASRATSSLPLWPTARPTARVIPSSNCAFPFGGSWMQPVLAGVDPVRLNPQVITSEVAAFRGLPPYWKVVALWTSGGLPRRLRVDRGATSKLAPSADR